MVSRPVALEDVRLRPPALRGRGCARGSRRRGGGARARRRRARACRCRGKSYLDLLRQRAGDCEDAPDAVVAPGDAAEAQQVIYACSEEGVAVVPYGGGTSVVGGAGAAARPLRRADLARPRAARRAAVARRALAARRGSAGGTRLPEADHALARHGLHARPHAAELRVGDGRRLRRRRARPARRRPASGASTSTWSALRCATPVGELATLAVPATRGRAVAAASS